MSKPIELPPSMNGDEAAQLQQVWSYLYQMAEDLNSNFAATGGNDLTDAERKVMQTILDGTAGDSGGTDGIQEMESLKSLIIKTADYVINTIAEFRTSFIGEATESGQFGEYVRQTRLDVDVTPTGVTQNYSFREIIQGLRTYEVNAKNYIKTGLLRTVNGLPVYGVAIGKDIVTFSEDGTETYNDGNKVAELTADELSFWQNESKMASYKGNRISFYSGDTEVMYIQNGKIWMQSGGWTFDDKGMLFEGTGMAYPFRISSLANRGSEDAGIAMNYSQTLGELVFSSVCSAVYHTPPSGNSWQGDMRLAMMDEANYMGPDGAYESGKKLVLYSPGDFQIGKKGNIIRQIYLGEIRGNGSGTSGTILIAPGQDDIYGVYVQYYTASNGNKYIRFRKTMYTDGLTFEGNVDGDVYGNATSAGYVKCEPAPQTNFNSLTSSGKYYGNPGGMTNGPSGLTTGTVEIDVTRIDNSNIFQRIYDGGNIYTRRMASGTWGSWYKFTGTAV